MNLFEFFGVITVYLEVLGCFCHWIITESSAVPHFPDVLVLYVAVISDGLPLLECGVPGIVMKQEWPGLVSQVGIQSTKEYMLKMHKTSFNMYIHMYIHNTSGL